LTIQVDVSIASRAREEDTTAKAEGLHAINAFIDMLAVVVSPASTSLTFGKVAI
jgi:hypothetical protein